MATGKHFLNVILSITFFFLLKGGMQFIDGMDFSKLKLSCKGYPVSMDEKVLAVAKTCKSELEVSRKKANLSADGMDFGLCVGGCVLQKENLIDEKGYLNVKNLEKFEHMLTKVPKTAQEPLKVQIKNCFEKFENGTVLDVSSPNNCWGLVSIGLCIKSGVEEACAGDDDGETTTEEASVESSEDKS